MKPIKTARTTSILHQPEDWDEAKHGPCVGLPVVQTEGPYFFSYWKTTWRDRLAILIGRPVRMCVASRLHPPIMLDTVRN